MREIKFRAWDGKKMQYDVFPTSDNTVGRWIKTGGGIELRFCDGGGTKVDIMQFTGLKDKNGKEIYFDDIVRWNKKLWVIVWSITLSNIQLQPLDNYIEQQNNPDIKRLFGASFGVGQAQYSAYIGNIHTTPELMEKQ